MNERPRFLADLAEEDRALQAPPRVGRMLRSRVASAARPRPRRWTLAWPAAVAVARTLAAAAPAPKLRRKPPPVTPPARQPVARPFYSLAYAPPELLANSRLLRVRVPRAALLSFGLPLNAYRPEDEKVEADVIYTEDGVARAIRFVNNGSRQ